MISDRILFDRQGKQIILMLAAVDRIGFFLMDIVIAAKNVPDPVFQDQVGIGRELDILVFFKRKDSPIQHQRSLLKDFLDIDREIPGFQRQALDQLLDHLFMILQQGFECLVVAISDPFYQFQILIHGLII
jgi:hypothetical protein